MSWIDSNFLLVLAVFLSILVGLALYAWNKKTKPPTTLPEANASPGDEVYYLAHHDVLTGLLNRYALISSLDQALKAVARANAKLAIIFIDLDRFKTVNDSLGHHVGDALLLEAANRLKGTVRSSDIVGRLGGDEFVIAMPGMGQEIDVAHMAQKILDALSKPYTLQGNLIHITSSMGISVYPDDGEDSEVLMKYADTAMYHAKAGGRNQFQFFTRSMHDAAMERMRIERDLHGAVERGEFILHYQPQINVMSGKVIGVEALLRWQHPRQGLLYPESFIKVAEETGLITGIGEWVLNTACTQLKQWLRTSASPLQMSVNLSAVEFRQEGLPAYIQSVLSDTDLNGGSLRLEITETAMMREQESVVDMLHALNKIGVTVEIDDFGTGYSSFSHLIKYPIDKLKIDRTFVQDIETDAKNAAVCAAIIALAHNVGLDVVAEGINSERQYEYFKRLGCDEMQGYYFSMPLPGEEIEAYVTSRNASRPQIDNQIGKVEVLIVDDDEWVCSALQKIIESIGLPVATSLDPLQALKMLEEHPQRFGLILMDMLMPKMSGVQLFHAVRKLNRAVPCVAISAYKPEYILQALQPYADELGLQPGMNFFIIEKPFVAAEVTDLARRILM